MTDEQKERRKEWYEHAETQAFLAALRNDRQRLAEAVVAAFASGTAVSDPSFVGGQINAIDAVLMAARDGTR